MSQSVDHLVAPVHLQLLYPFVRAESWSDARVWNAAFEVVFCGSVFFLSFRSRPRFALGLLIVYISLLPMLRAPEMHFVADRYLLLSSVGLVIVATEVLSFLGSRRSFVLICAPVVASFAYFAWNQTAVWKSDVNLWRHAYEGIQPPQVRVVENFAVALRDGKQWGESASLYRELLRRLPKKEPVRFNYLLDSGNVLMQEGRPGEAEDNLREAVQLRPSSASAFLNLGVAQAEMKKFREAQENLERAIRLEPSNPEAYFNLGRLALERKDSKTIAFVLERVEKLAPRDPRLAVLKNAVRSFPK